MVYAIYSTTSGIDESRKIARALVELKLVACVNILPEIESIYRWKGAIEKETESAFIAKTTKENVNQAINKIREIHSYDVPDIVAFPLPKGLKAYFQYVEDETV